MSQPKRQLTGDPGELSQGLARVLDQPPLRLIHGPCEVDPIELAASQPRPGPESAEEIG